uniref:P-type domain-containing protein n=1 Tax=Sphenodon punctatus TaxID=8508 RepID=A0A8D0HAN5_SPHPU
GCAGGAWELLHRLILGSSPPSEKKLTCILFLTASSECEVQPKARINCGYPYISAEACNDKGCCYDSSISGVAWCFFPSSDDGTTSITDCRVF